MLDQYRRRVQQASANIAKLQKEKGALARKRADLQRRVSAANARLSRTSAASTAHSKLNEIERLHKDSSSNESRIASIDQKIAVEQTKFMNAQKQLSTEEEREAKKRQRATEQANRQIITIDKQLRVHDSLHRQTKVEIEQLKYLPEQIVVLFLASNPLDQAQLRLDEEVRAIQDMIRKAEHRDAVKLESRWAMRPSDLIQAINEHAPSIIHFSGHGSSRNELVFQDDSGNAKLVTKEAIVQVMRACSESIQLVLFNTCYSRDQAAAVVKHVPSAVGMNTTIGDDAARVFSSQFYSAIGFGKSVKVAFEQAKAALMLEKSCEEDTPELFVGGGNDPNELFIVRPPLDAIEHRIPVAQ